MIKRPQAKNLRQATALLLCLLFCGACFAANAEAQLTTPAQLWGVWEAQSEEDIYDYAVFSEDRTLSWYNEENGECTLVFQGMLSLEPDGDGLYMTCFTGGQPFSQAFAAREGWMDLTDGSGVTTSWHNVTPETPVNEGLRKDPLRPIVGVWSQTSDDTALWTLEIHADGYFALSDLAGKHKGDLLGLYQLKDGILTLYPTEMPMGYADVRGDTLRIDDGENNMVLTKSALPPLAAAAQAP